MSDKQHNDDIFYNLLLIQIRYSLENKLIIAVFISCKKRYHIFSICSIYYSWIDVKINNLRWTCLMRVNVNERGEKVWREWREEGKCGRASFNDYQSERERVKLSSTSQTSSVWSQLSRGCTSSSLLVVVVLLLWFRRIYSTQTGEFH